MIEILSAQNAKFKGWSALLDARGIKKSGRALISGKKLVNEFLMQNADAAEELLYPPKGEAAAAPQHIKSYRLSSALFNALDVMGTKSPLLIIKTPAIDAWQGSDPQGLELITALSDPGNLGALLRSAEAFGVARVILAQESCSPFLPKAIRASSGACFRLPLATTGPLREIKVKPVFALDMAGENIAQFKWPNNLYIVLGEEGRGIPKSLAATSISIPMQGNGESLNAMVAASIALYSYRNRH